MPIRGKILCIYLVLFFLVNGCDTSTLSDKYDEELYPGMSMKEVKDLMGEPANARYLGSGKDEWWYFHHDRRLFVVFRDGIVIRKNDGAALSDDEWDRIFGKIR